MRVMPVDPPEDDDDGIDDNDLEETSDWESAYERMEDERQPDSSGHDRYSRRDPTTQDAA